MSTLIASLRELRDFLNYFEKIEINTPYIFDLIK